MSVGPIVGEGLTGRGEGTAAEVSTNAPAGGDSADAAVLPPDVGGMRPQADVTQRAIGMQTAKAVLAFTATS